MSHEYGIVHFNDRANKTGYFQTPSVCIHQGTEADKSKPSQPYLSYDTAPSQCAIKRFRRLQILNLSIQESRGRPTVYGKDADAALKDVWELTGMLCAELLHPEISIISSRTGTGSILTGVAVQLRAMKRRIATFPKVKRVHKTAECMLPDEHLEKLIST